jgi:hypothetical protein
VAALLLFGRPRYIGGMLWRNSRGRPINAPAAFIHPCQPIVAKQPPTGPGWAHELKHDGYHSDVRTRNAKWELCRDAGLKEAANFGGPDSGDEFQ